jgi:hypothetical protein
LPIVLRSFLHSISEPGRRWPGLLSFSPLSDAFTV